MGVKAAGGARSYADARRFCRSRGDPYWNVSWVAILKGELADGDY